MIILACDHRGWKLKEDLKRFFNNENITTIDVGTYSKERVDYPDFVKLGCAKVIENASNVGIFVCGTGIGMEMAANRNPKIRAANCTNEKYASRARAHNDANVLCLAGDYISTPKAIKIVKEFLTTKFEGGRYARRLKKL